jgi:hypothetical protein
VPLNQPRKVEIILAKIGDEAKILLYLFRPRTCEPRIIGLKVYDIE